MPGDWFKVSQSDIGLQSKTLRLQGQFSSNTIAALPPGRPPGLRPPSLIASFAITAHCCPCPPPQNIFAVQVCSCWQAAERVGWVLSAVNGHHPNFLLEGSLSPAQPQPGLGSHGPHLVPHEREALTALSVPLLLICEFLEMETETQTGSYFCVSTTGLKELTEGAL